ncbi:MAG: cation-translocating P-type ATPase [Steroidobacteraceae bacterium]
MQKQVLPATTPLESSTGLDEAQARQRLASEGPNELSKPQSHGLARLVGQVLLEPMFLLLIGAVVLYVVLGSRREAGVLALSLVLILLITIVQERRTERALQALRDLSSPRAMVIRDGTSRRIAGREVVRGDTVLLAEGDRVPADGVLRAAIDLSIDESLLTGESAAVVKQPDSLRTAMAPTNVDAESCVYAGTLVVRGHGTVEVLATGARTEFGRIGHALTTLQPEQTPLYAEINRLIRWVAAIGIGVCAFVTILYALLRDGWLQGALAGITLAMTVLPEEFPVVLTIFMAIGAWRLSKQGVLTRRLPAIEALGAATVLALDKTGTLTENRMSVAVLDAGSTRAALDQPAAATIAPALSELLGVAHAACELETFDPMEHAIRSAAAKHAPAQLVALGGASLIREYDLTPEVPAVTHVWRETAGGALRIAMKGAPETVIAICGLDAVARAGLLRRVDELAQDGLRVLAVASGTFEGAQLPSSPRDLALDFRGLIGLRDPVRKTVPAALARCRQAGIRVLMVTGDHRQTAFAIARQVGIQECDVHARTTPAQKLALIRKLRDQGEVVAMIGDGVNDAPALKAAHIGVAMGSRGTDVAREAAALVLLDDELPALVAAIGAGRGIYENIRAAMTYLLAVHLPLAGIGLSPLLFGWPLLLFPLHVAFLEFIIDPSCSLVFENDRRGDSLMRTCPRDPKQQMLSRTMLTQSLALGAMSLLAVAVVYAIALHVLPEDEARALGFIALVVSNLTLILATRARATSLRSALRSRNLAFWIVNVAALSALVAVVTVPVIAEAFRLAQPSLLAACAAAAAAIAGVFCTNAIGAAFRRNPSQDR